MGRRQCSTFWFRSRVRGDGEMSDHMYDDAMNENVVDELVSYDDSVRWQSRKNIEGEPVCRATPRTCLMMGHSSVIGVFVVVGDVIH